jgi:RimJ/RimL family protein N-acetyltransferase
MSMPSAKPCGEFSRSNTFQLEALREAHFERLHLLFDAVCRERRFMAFTEAGPKEQTFEYYRHVVSGGHTHFVAVREEQVLGWCDVLPPVGQMRAHVGVLGMGVAAAERGKGVGKALIQAAVAKATERGLTRLELTVHRDNKVAQALYKAVGFVHEGTLRRAWLLDGQHHDIYLMARLL